jgi:hypothetical protein
MPTAFGRLYFDRADAQDIRLTVVRRADAGISELDKSAAIVYYVVREYETRYRVRPVQTTDPAFVRSLLVATNVVRPPNPMSPPPDRSKEGWEEAIGTIMSFFIDEGS